MSLKNNDFYGKNVAEAIKSACNDFGVAQENLTIEVLETGSKGIFGLIRQKAHIRARIQETEEAQIEQPREKSSRAAKPKAKKKSPKPDRVKPKPATPVKEDPEAAATSDNDSSAEPDLEEKLIEEKNKGREPVQLSDDALAVIKDELTKILELMECPSAITVDNEDGTAHCRVSAEHQEVLTSQEGRVLDSLQYLLRKIVSKKIAGRIQLTIDVGNYREKRYQELRELAVEFSTQVKEDGKTQVIPSLSPSERRVVHVALQDDPEIRSRSVGEGLFKKVLIYKPGKGRRNNSRKRGRSKYRKKNDSGPKKEA